LIKADGHFVAFFSRPIAGVLGSVTIAVWVSPLVIRWWRGRVRSVTD